MSTGACVIGVCLSVCLSVPAGAANDSGGDAGGMELKLDEAAIACDGGKVKYRLPLDITVYRRNGKWIEGQAFGYNRGAHRVRVAAMEQTGDTVEVEVEALVARDSWVPGGAGVYTGRLTRAGEIWTGDWKGVWAYGPEGPLPCEGKASLRFLPKPNRSTVAGFVGESPVLLFRKADLPRLRQRLATPLGRVLAARMAEGNAICRGVLFQLTGDAAHAVAARELTEKTMAERAGGSFAVGRVWGYRAFDVAVAYDLCREAWDASFRRKVEWYLDWISEKCLIKPWTLSNRVNLNPGSNYMVVIYSGAAVAALARVGDRTPEPLPPDERFIKFISVSPPAGYNPPERFPVEVMKPGVPPTNWVYAGHWPETELTAEEAARALPRDGAAWSRWGIGVTFTPGDYSFKLRLLKDDEYYPDQDKVRRINLTEVCMPSDKNKEQTYFQRAVLATALTVPEKMVLRSRMPGELFMGGERIMEGDCFIAEPGTYPIVFMNATGEMYGTPWGHEVRTPCFDRVDEVEQKRLLAGRAIEYAVLRHIWEDDVREWKETGGTDRTRFRLVRRGAQLNRMNLQNGMGDGGFQTEGEGYTLECFRPLLDYALIYRNVFGEELSARPDASHFAARYCFTSIWDDPGGNDRGPLMAQSFGGGKGILSVDYLSRCYPLTPDDWKPALHWFWLRKMGVQAEEVRTTEGAEKAFGKWTPDMGLVLAFLYYPLDGQPRNPAELMPRAWVADGKGFFAFRNKWDGADDIVAQFYAKDGPRIGWNSPEAGCFQLAGLGHEWAAKGAHDRGGDRWLENVVLMPDDELIGHAYCKVVHRAVDATEARGSVSVNMDELYKVMKPVGNGNRKEAVDGGIRGRRAFAADLSGRAGVPAVVAVADRITGGGRKVWQMFVPGLTADAVTTQAGGFTIRKGDAILCGTVVAPDKAKITAHTPPADTQPTGARPDAAFRGIRVQGADPTSGDFWVVMTLQKGEAPAVKARGSGLKAELSIGKAALRFADGTLVWDHTWRPK